MERTVATIIGRLAPFRVVPDRTAISFFGALVRRGGILRTLHPGQPVSEVDRYSRLCF
ncbi:MAG: hypothetical protein JWO48_316, partial [Bryobacterales bacterium]|nr:hypothetical protein [Bryobacterales bacterium]